MAVLGIEPRALCKLGKCLPHPQPSSEHLKGKDKNRTGEAEGKSTAY